jgi:hypothetical protein
MDLLSVQASAEQSTGDISKALQGAELVLLLVSCQGTLLLPRCGKMWGTPVKVEALWLLPAHEGSSSSLGIVWTPSK